MQSQDTNIKTEILLLVGSSLNQQINETAYYKHGTLHKVTAFPTAGRWNNLDRDSK